MGGQQRSLALPHRALRASAVNRFHTWTGGLLLVVVAPAAFLERDTIWQWQGHYWQEMATYFGIGAVISGTDFHWAQVFLMPTLTDVLLTSVAFFLTTWLVFRSTFPPTVKGFFAMVTIPLFLYALVVYLQGTPPGTALAHTGPEWLYGEVFVWCLIPLLYAFFLFPVPLALPVKLFSLAVVLAMAVVWRTATPVAYMLIAIYSQGLLAIPAWMALGPWSDFLYVIPMYAATLALYRGGRRHDYRA